MTDELAGTWMFNDTLTFGSSNTTYNIDFLSNNTNFTSLNYIFANPLEAYLKYDSVIVYNVGSLSWTDEAYKTITITSKLSEVTSGDALLAWLQANATKQASSKVSIDLTTLSGWSSLSTGSHSITIVAKAENYRDSEPSAAVSVTKAAEVTLISFTIGGTSYQAEEGMTWEEWVNSSYNTISSTVAPDGKITFPPNGVGNYIGLTDNSDNDKVVSTDVIIAQMQYYGQNSGGQ